MQRRPKAQYEFHIARSARELYDFDQSLFRLSGNVIFANFNAARIFAQKMNAQRDLVNFPETAVRAGQINAMGLIDEILHYVIYAYTEQRNPEAMAKALDWVDEKIGPRQVDKALLRFGELFPPLAVYRGEIELHDYLSAESEHDTGRGVVANRQIMLEELLMLWLANANPAFAPFLELFDDRELEKTAYDKIVSELHDFFETQPPFGPENQNLFDMLRAPALASPDSLSGQLDFIRARWAGLLDQYLFRLLSSMDLIKEEEKAVFFGPGPARVLEFSGEEFFDEPERFSVDLDWMPNLVLMAKNTYVWLDQLSKHYERPITKLDEIPEDVLRRLARWGFTGLWLIGLWERSPASKRIKQLRGNEDAVASAYSLFSYDIAQDLGGEDAYRVLRDRAWKYGVRLASDMVPNHMGIDSRWVIEHPNWFIQLDYPPFPSYTFNGPNLSWDDRVGIYIEDHYYNNTDAAVVFKRVDHWTGETRYVYHGNDGTSMPWNDTAQLNYLLPEVREAVIQTILHVARRFPVIRFDAAMTLAKRHYQRLWFPEPGSGGDIPSRAEFGMTREAFNAAFPEEFWREVVDRVAAEAPDTLLLAEAFWMMEGYFVRSLGMHRVYNSAFMNMLRDEKNQEYRLVIKNTVEFDAEILKRYVNFMNNPDEKTAVEQFGKGDKYFGIATMMATMPGLPMFGHGQIEGYTEKYGMEFRRAYWDEKPDLFLVDRHEREIFPLLRRRYLFAEVDNYRLYDFYTGDGAVNEDVFAYSNRAGEERSLVLYHNKFNSTAGWIRTSAAFSVKTGQGDDRTLRQESLGEGLNLPNDGSQYVIFRDHVTNLEYLRNCQEIHHMGLFAELHAYQYHVFVNFRVVPENEWGQYGQLAAQLEGRGAPSIDDAIKELYLQPIHEPFRQLVNAGSFEWLIQNRASASGEVPATQEAALDEAESKYHHLLVEIEKMFGEPLVAGEAGSVNILSEASDPAVAPELIDLQTLAEAFRSDLEAALQLPALEKQAPIAGVRKQRQMMTFLEAPPEAQPPADQAGAEKPTGWNTDDPYRWGVLLGWVVVRNLGQALESGAAAQSLSRAWIDEWLLGKYIANTLHDLNVPTERANRAVTLIKLLTNHQGWQTDTAKPKNKRALRALNRWFGDGETQQFLGVNRHNDILWFNAEAFDTWLWWAFLGAAVDTLTDDAPELDALYTVVQTIQKAEIASAYQVTRLLEAANPKQAPQKVA